MLRMEEALDSQASLGNIELHDHVGMLYEGQEMMLRNMARLVRQAHILGDHSIILTTGVTKDRLSRVMNDLGMPSDQFLYEGFFEHRDFIPSDSFGIESTSALDLMTALYKRGLGLGFHAVWILLDMRLLEGMDRAERIEFEALSNQLVDEEEMVLVCFYDSCSLSDGGLMDVINTHQLIWHRGLLCHNYFYNPPEQMQHVNEPTIGPYRILDKMTEIQLNEISLRNEETGSQDIYNRLMEEVRRRELMEWSLLESENNYRNAFNALGDQVFVVDRELRIVMANEPFHELLKTYGHLDEVVGHELTEVMPELKGGNCREYETVFLTGRTMIKDVDIAIDGVNYLVEVRKVPIIIGGRIDRVLTVIRGLNIKEKLELMQIQNGAGRSTSYQSFDHSEYM